VVEPVALDAGYDLEELSVVRMGRRYVVRVTVDRDGGVGLDAVADLSRDISQRLDATEAADGEFIAGEYRLEVSSPGTGRPLTEPRHWRRNIGRLVTVRIAGAPVTGRIVAADEDGATLSVDGAGASYPYADLGRGRIEVEFGRLDDVDDDDLIPFADDDGDADDGDDDDGDDDDDFNAAEAEVERAAAARDADEEDEE
jgi:ribosome maturation factor RimP